MFYQFLLLLLHSQVAIARPDRTQSIKHFEFIKFVKLPNDPPLSFDFDGQRNGRNNRTERTIGNVHHTLSAHFLRSHKNTAFVRADNPPNQQLHVDLFSLDRLFAMVLIPSVNFPVIATRSNRSSHFNATCFTGFLRDWPSASRLFAYFHNDLLNAVISAFDDVFHLDELDNQTVIMYRERDVHFSDYGHSKAASTSDRPANRSSKHSASLAAERFPAGQQSPDQSTRSKNKQNNLIEFLPTFRRLLFAGAPSAVLYPYRPSICEIELVADHTFSEFFRHDTVRISSELFLMLMKANMIFSQMDFNLDGRPDGVSLQLSRIVIFHTPNEKGYTWSSTQLRPQQVLESFGLRIQTHCLAVTFLHRDFSTFKGDANGVLGLAWVGELGKSFGICSKPMLNPQVSAKELWNGNTGIITNVNRGRTRSRAEASSTLSHEIGHSFGAKHDDSADVIKKYGQCSSKYLMSAVDSGEQIPTKFQFSYCSKQQINPVLQTKSTCFKPYQPRCGNGIKEYGEECDCGPEFVCSQIDPCCQASTCRLKPECGHRRLPAYQPVPKPTDHWPPVTVGHGPVPPNVPPRPPYYPPNTYPPVYRPPNRPAYPPSYPVYPPPNRMPPPFDPYYRLPPNYPPFYRPPPPNYPPLYYPRPNQPMVPYDPRVPYGKPPPPFRKPIPQPPPTNRSLDRFKYFPDKKDENEDIFKFVPRDDYDDSFVYDDVSYGSFV